MRGVLIIYNGVAVHTGRDLDLVQEKKEIGAPTYDSILIDVPGRNGLVNATKSLTGKTVYKSRKITLQYFYSGARAKMVKMERWLNQYHGEVIDIVDDDTDGAYYRGECSVKTVYHGTYVTFTITVEADPFLVDLDYTTYKVSLSSTAKQIVVDNPGVEVVPILVVGSSATVTCKSNTYTLQSGEYELGAFELAKGSNLFTVKGSGSFTIKFYKAVV